MTSSLHAAATAPPARTLPPPATPPAETKFQVPKLHALTSLRFFAAAMIVMLHSQAYFGAIKPLARFTLTQGVCFFFVLSGFILTYAYPSLDMRGARRFLVARLARIVPLHVVAFLLYVIALPAWYRDSVSRDTHGAGLLSLFLLQAWVPVYRVQTAFNGVSWSLSVELFFYLCFPLLLWRWRRTWRVKLALAFLLVCGAILVANRWLAHLPRGAEVRDVVYFYPLARLWEFVVGVATAHLWRSLRPRIRCERWIGTALEVAILAATFAAMFASGAWARHMGHWAIVGPGGEAWLASSGFVCLPFAALICVMAFEWGWVARFLACRPFVLLGEISYSLYLLHLLVCHYYVIHPGPFVALPPWLLYLGYWTIVLLVAYVGWSAIEVPCRRTIVSFWDRHIARDAERRARIVPNPVRRAPRRTLATFARQGNIAASGALLLIFATIHFAGGIAAPPSPMPVTIAPSAGRAVVAVDTVGNHPAVHDAPVVVNRRDYPSDAMAVVGWSVDPVDRGPVRGVQISVDDRPSTWAEYGSGRNDVSAQFGGDAFLHSGYIGMVSLKGLSDGPHTLTIRALARGDGAFAETRQALTVR
jgi:peptidoglycan/LPS O-acetylase OafA/YrhL